MSGHERALTKATLGFVMRPSVCLAMPWIYVCSMWFVGMVVTAKFTVTDSAQHHADGPITGLLSVPALVTVSVVNALFLVALAADGRVAWRRHRSLERTQLAGVLLCLVNIVLLQWGALLAHDPFFGR